MWYWRLLVGCFHMYGWNVFLSCRTLWRKSLSEYESKKHKNYEFSWHTLFLDIQVPDDLNYGRFIMWINLQFHGQDVCWSLYREACVCFIFRQNFQRHTDSLIAWGLKRSLMDENVSLCTLTLFHNKTNTLQYWPPRYNWLVLKVVYRSRSFREPLFELVVTTRGTLTRKLVSKRVFVELNEISPSPSCSVRGEGTAEASSAELTLALTHSWYCDKEDSTWFQS